MKVSDIIRELNRLGGKHGIGIVDICENRLVGKFTLRDARRRIDPGKTHWRGTFVLSALEVLKLAGPRTALRYVTGKPLK